MDLLPSSYDNTILGFLGAGVSVGIGLSRGEKLNIYAVVTALVAGAIMGETSTAAFLYAANLNNIWSDFIAFTLGVCAMGFVKQAFDGKLPILSKILGGGSNDERK